MLLDRTSNHGQFVFLHPHEPEPRAKHSKHVLERCAGNPQDLPERRAAGARFRATRPRTCGHGLQCFRVGCSLRAGRLELQRLHVEREESEPSSRIPSARGRAPPSIPPCWGHPGFTEASVSRGHRPKDRRAPNPKTGGLG